MPPVFAVCFITWGLDHGVSPGLMGMMSLHGLRPFLFPYEQVPAVVMWGVGYMTMGKFVKVLGFQSIIFFFWYIAAAYFWLWMIP